MATSAFSSTRFFSVSPHATEDALRRRFAAEKATNDIEGAADYLIAIAILGIGLELSHSILCLGDRCLHTILLFQDRLSELIGIPVGLVFSCGVAACGELDLSFPDARVERRSRSS